MHQCIWRHIIRISIPASSKRLITMDHSNIIKKPTLIAFDFDHTIIEDNSDVFVQTLAVEGKIPDEIKNTYRSKNWIEFMNNVFKHLHQGGVSPQHIFDCMAKITWTPGMKELISHFVDNDANYEAIIISDSNSVFINKILELAGLVGAFKQVFTNQAHFDDSGLLKVRPYHQQDWCDLSTENMCKGHILDSYINDRHRSGVEFERIAYVGDGSNDLCPSIRLSKTDLVFPRKGFALMKLIEKETHVNNVDQHVIAKVIPWETGLEIYDTLTNAAIP